MYSACLASVRHPNIAKKLKEIGVWPVYFHPEKVL
jgi:hypothetical protein